MADVELLRRDRCPTVMRMLFAGSLALVVCGAATLAQTTPETRPVGLFPHVTVGGLVRTPGLVAADRPLRLLEAISQAGGLDAQAAVIEIRRRALGWGPVTLTTPAAEYRVQYVVLTEASADANNPLLFNGDAIIVRPVLELHPATPAGQFGARAFRLDWTTWGVAAPEVLTMSEPLYTRAGFALKLQGNVEVEVLVNADGSVGDARVVRGLDARLPALLDELRRHNGPHEQWVLQTVGNGPIGLDANALECVKTWTFQPGTILGKPTPVIQTVSVAFKLR
jgi:hypothetical protein